MLKKNFSKLADVAKLYRRWCAKWLDAHGDGAPDAVEPFDAATEFMEGRIREIEQTHKNGKADKRSYALAEIEEARRQMIRASQWIFRCGSNEKADRLAKKSVFAAKFYRWQWHCMERCERLSGDAIREFRAYVDDGDADAYERALDRDLVSREYYELIGTSKEVYEDFLDFWSIETKGATR